VEVVRVENGLFRKEKVREIDPPMADGTTLDHVREIFECRVCLGLFHKDNVRCCLACGHDYCRFRACRGEVKIPGDGSIFVCAPCAEVNNRGLLERISRKFWRLER
jgi:hypothetical protein